MYSSEHKEQKIDDSHITKLYYGFNRVYFKQCKGKTFRLDPHKTDSFKSLSDSKHLKIVKDRRNPQSDLGNEYSHLLLPSMPCTDIEIVISKNESESESDKNTKLNESLLSIAPLIKTQKSDFEMKPSVIGYKSGVRSALVCLDSVWYRLKGCGNHDSGHFPFQCIDDGRKPLVEIRGCSFKHTSFRELRMTNEIDAILGPFHIRTANTSHGWYEYNIDKYCPQIIRTCSVFQTLGNKRFGSHLLQGLVSVLPIIVDLTQVSLSSIYALFNDKRQLTNEKWKVMQTYLAVLCEMDTINLWNNSENIINIPLRSVSIDGQKQSFPNENKQRLWQYQCEEYNHILSQITNKRVENALIIEIYHRLGFESGAIQKLLHSNHVSWGTYNDSLGTHCNAHCNNYVILPFDVFRNKGKKDSNLNFCLAPLDFDMAFYRNEYIQNMSDEQKSKERVYTFDELLTMECNGNRASLSGDPHISTGVHWNGDAALYRYTDKEEKNKFDLINWALRDTLICSFDKAYQTQYSGNKCTAFEWDEDKEKLMYAIFNLALIATLDVVA